MTPRATQLDIFIVADSSSTNETALLQRSYEFLIEKHRNTNWDALLRYAEVSSSRSETSQRFGLRLQRLNSALYSCRHICVASNPPLTFLLLHYCCVCLSVFPVKYGRLFDHLRPSAFTFHSPPVTSVAPPVPEEGAHCAPPSISPVIGRSGAVGVDYVGLGSFPRSDYPDLLGRNRPLPLGPSPPPPPLPPLPLFSLIRSFGIARALHFFQIWSLTAWMTSVVSICVTTRAWCHRALPQASGKLNFMSTNVQ